MTEQTIVRVKRLYGWLLSAAIFASGICLIAACVGIYHNGAFSREAVATAFSHIRIPVYLCLGLVIGAFVLELLIPVKPQKLKPEKQEVLILRNLHSKADLTSCEEDLRSTIAGHQKKRKLHKSITAILLGLATGHFLSYALNPAHFHQTEINASMIQAMYHLIPCLAVPFGYAVFTVYYCRSSIRKEIALLKQVPRGASPAPAAPVRKDHSVKMRWAVLTVAIAILIFGFVTGGTQDVLTKAVNICTECVGLG